MLLFALFVLLAQGMPPVPPPMPVDEDPTAAACTFASALAGENCSYEGAGAAGDPRKNSQLAAESGARMCAQAARGDKDLRKDCERSAAEASLSWECALESRLADANGKLTADARDCVFAIGEAIRHASMAAASSLSCCKCLSEAHCSVAPAQCQREVADLRASAALLACISKSSCNSCSWAMPAKPAKSLQTASPSDDPTQPDKI